MSVQSFAIKSRIRNSRSLLQISRRFKGSAAAKIIASEHAEEDPLEVLSIHSETITEPKRREVVLEILTAPVNQVDINIIEGKYPSRFNQAFVPGYEGVGRVLDRGPAVTSLMEGDHVVPLKSNLGTWRTHMTLPEDILRKVPKELGLAEAATLICNSSTAYTMLKDFVNLKPGDTVIQNGGNSSVGQLIIQLCKLWGIHSVNIVRDRPDVEQLKDHLQGLGADYVFTEEEIRKTDIFKKENANKPKLALNCVGGKSSSELARHLQNSGHLVTYGSMSKEPVVIPTGILIFNDIRVEGFVMTRWAEETPNIAEKRETMLKNLIAYYLDGTLKVANCTTVHFSKFKEAINNTIHNNKNIVRQKYFLQFNDL